MPRAKKISSTLTLSEFDKVAATVNDLLVRMRVTLLSHAPSLQLVERLASAGFFPTSTAATKTATTKATSSKASAASNGAGVKRRRRRRPPPPVDSAKVIAAVKDGGAAGKTSGQLAQALKVPTERLRQELYKLRDAGSLRMVGKLSKAKYVVADSQGATRVKHAKPAARDKGAKRGKSVKQAKPAKKPEAAASA